MTLKRGRAVPRINRLSRSWTLALSSNARKVGLDWLRLIQLSTKLMHQLVLCISLDSKGHQLISLRRSHLNDNPCNWFNKDKLRKTTRLSRTVSKSWWRKAEILLLLKLLSEGVAISYIIAPQMVANQISSTNWLYNRERMEAWRGKHSMRMLASQDCRIQCRGYQSHR